MAKTNSERQKEFKERQKRKAEAGAQLLKIFGAHFKAIKKLLTPEERARVDEIEATLSG